MQYRRGLVVLIFALACQGELIDNTIPGTGQPPTSFIPALAFRIGGTGTDLITALVTDPAGNLYLAGTFTGSADFDPGTDVTALTSLGGRDGFIAKYSGTGALLWARRFGGTGDERVTALARDPAGNLYLGGGFEGSARFDPSSSGIVLNSVGGEDGFIAKYSSDGALLWARRFGGTGLDEVAAVAVDAAGNGYAAGGFTGQANALPTAGPTILSNGGTDGFLVSLGSDGTIRWAMPLGGPQDDAARGVAVASDGNVLAAGSFRSIADFSRNGGSPTTLTSLGGADLFYASYSSAGVLQRVRGFGGVNNDSMPAGGLAVDPQDGPVLLGGFSGSVDFDPGPGVTARTSLSALDLFLARYDSNGDFVSVAAVGGLGTVTGTRVVADADGSALVTGSFSGPVDFDPSTATRVLTSFGIQGATDAFVARFTSAGGLVWAGQFGEFTTLADRTNGGAALGFEPAGNLIVAGHFFGSPDFDPGATAFRLTSLGEADGFVVKLTSNGALAQ